VTIADWVSAHEFLRPIADLHARVDAAVAAAAPPRLALPDWNAYLPDFTAGLPLLASPGAAIDLGRADEAVARAIEALGADGGEPRDAGMLHYVGAVVLTRSLEAIVHAFAEWRDDERWLHPHCPTCGSLPAMAQLVGVDPGRRRLLACGCCGTRWRYARTTCPFCEVRSHRLASVGVEGEGGLRIDYCESCRAYLKTYNGQGAEAVMLADWTSLHLDLAARDRGLRREAASLYELEPRAA
jgi:FdhE protein